MGHITPIVAREETSGDLDSIVAVHEIAFGRHAERKLVKALRKETVVVASIVAEAGRTVDRFGIIGSDGKASPLRTAERNAVRREDGFVCRRRVDRVKLPQVRHNEMTALDETQSLLLLEAGHGTWIQVPVTVALFTGLRGGELCALRSPSRSTGWRRTKKGLLSTALTRSTIWYFANQMVRQSTRISFRTILLSFSVAEKQMPVPRLAKFDHGIVVFDRKVRHFFKVIHAGQRRAIYSP